MVSKKAAWKPQEGDAVKVPWGFDHVHGVVREIYGPPGRPTALVVVILEGPKGEAIGEQTVSMPLDALERADAAAAS